MPHYDNYKIAIDGKWNLEDLYKFPRAYEQVYYAFEAITPADNEGQEDKIQRAFKAYPWRGGYSAVNFYDQLKWATDQKRRPEIVSAKYASLGWLELFLNQPLAIQLASSITSVALSIGTCNKVYHAIFRDLQNRKLLRLEVETRKIAITKEELQLIKEYANDLTRILSLPPPDALHVRTQDPLKSLKILMSVYRRVRLLAEYVNRGKADFFNAPPKRKDKQ